MDAAASHAIIHALHLLVLGPLLIAIGLGYLAGWPRVVAGLGIVIVLYHAWKTYAKWAAGKNPWVNLIHVLVVGPALIVEGSMSNPPRYVKEIILMLGIAAVGYHGYYLVADLVK
jgi:hypothetical protein